MRVKKVCHNFKAFLAHQLGEILKDVSVFIYAFMFSDIGN